MGKVLPEIPAYFHHLFNSFRIFHFYLIYGGARSRYQENAANAKAESSVEIGS
jgi:hypothetical protein